MIKLTEQLPDLISFAPLTLEQLNEASLQCRYESKYLFSNARLPQILNELKDDYYILEIEGIRQFQYLTRYFDTDDFRLFQDHHNGYGGRIKVRQRQYLESGQIFFEMKSKKAEIRTDKQRLQISKLSPELSNEELALINSSRFESSQLELKLSNDFTRITLCNFARTERVTIDTAVKFRNEEKSIALNGISLMEVKQERIDLQSPAIKAMKRNHIFESSCSKYAIGASLLYPTLKRNNLKPVLLKLQQLCKSLN